MVNVNKKYLDENLKSSVWRNFIKELKSAKTEKELERIINQIFAPTEQAMIEKRLAILFLLKGRLSYRKISELIDVAPNTISFVKKSFIKKERKPRRYTPDGPDKKTRSISRFPTYTGKGRWRFLNAY